MRPIVLASTVNVRRLRLLTPINPAPMAIARCASASSWTSTKRRDLQCARQCVETAQEVVVEDRGDQQDRVSHPPRRLPRSLVGIDDEVFAQHRQLARRVGAARRSSKLPPNTADSVSTDIAAAPPC